LAMDDALNFHESQRANERLRLLLDLTNRVVSTLDLPDLLREISASIRRVMNCDGVGVALPDPDSGLLTLVALDFPSGKGHIREGIVINDVASTVVRVYRSGRAINLTPEEIQKDGRVAQEAPKSLCRLPMIVRDKVLGVLTLGSHTETFFGDQ